MKNLDKWRDVYRGRAWATREVKEPHLVPLIADLNYPSDSPVLVEVGGGQRSMAERAISRGAGQISIANIDVALVKPHDDHDRIRHFPVDVDELAAGQLPDVHEELVSFIAERGDPNDPRADGIVLSEILNYVDSLQALAWADGLLKAGGFLVIANLHDRGIPDLLPEEGVRSDEELLSFCVDGLGYTIATQQYPWSEHETYGQFMVAALRKPTEPSVAVPDSVLIPA